MLSRRDILEDKMNVGPGQYSPEYSYGKNLSPSFRSFLCDLACGLKMVCLLIASLGPEHTNTNHILSPKKKGMILEKTINLKAKLTRFLALVLTNIKMQYSNMDPRWSLAMDLGLDWLIVGIGKLFFTKSISWARNI